MIFFELFTTAFMCIFYGVLITSVLMTVVYFVLRQVNRGTVSTIPFFLVGVVLFVSLSFQQTLMVGAIKAKGYLNAVAEYVEEIADVKDGIVERTSREVNSDYVQKIKKQFPEFSLFVDVDKFGESLNDMGTTVTKMKENTSSSLNYYILRRIMWSLGFLVAAIVIVCLLDSGSSSSERGNFAQRSYSSSSNQPDFRNRTYRRRRF